MTPESTMRYLSFCALVVLLAGCGDEPQPAAATPAKEPVSAQQQQINNTAAASAVGYDGQAVKRAVQRTVDTNNRQNEELQKAVDAASQSDPADATK
jgi:uncharacterized lipoprotein YajG